MLTIYGWKRSRAARCMWVMEELELEYTQVPLNQTNGETRTPEYLAINPAGKIPALVHDGFILRETVAINFYLASVFAGTLLPSGAQDLARLQQWTSWSIADLEPAMITILKEGRRPTEQIDASRIDAARAEVHKMLDTVLEPHLARQGNILPGPAFTLADVNVAAAVSSAPVLGIGLEQHPNVDRWMKRCFARPAWLRAQQRN